MYMMGLRNVKRQMDKLGTKVEPIPFVYNKKGFSCIFNIGVVPYQLIMTTLGLHPQSFRFDIERGYLLIPRLSEEEMQQLIRYLELKPNPNHRFSLESMMIAFDRRAKAHTIKLETTSNNNTNKNEDKEKSYFFKWQHNKKNRVSPENLDKTERYMGTQMREECERYNISSCWSSVPRVK